MSNDTAPAHAVLVGPQERVNVAADIAHDADNGDKGRRLLQHKIFDIYREETLEAESAKSQDGIHPAGVLERI